MDAEEKPGVGTSLQRYQRSVQLLLQAVCDLSLARDLETVQKIVRSTARRLNGADGATFVLRDGDQCFYADEDAIEPLWKGQRFPIDACVSGWAMFNRKPAVVTDIFADARVPVDAYRPTFVKSMVMVPIRTALPIGAIGNYWAQPHAPTAEEIELIQALADSTAIALENVQLYQQLERRVQERTAQLEVVNRELESFSYSVSHDLRAPLRQIAGLTEILVEDHAGQFDAAALQIVSSISGSVDKLQQLVNDLLQFSLLGNKSPAMEVIDMAGQARAAFGELSAQMQKAPQLVLGDLPPAWGDPALMRQVWINLLSNAVKYSGKRNAPVIEVGSRVENGASIYFVRDNGAGFDAAHAPKLFGVFQRMHTEAEFPGTGVGLSIVQRIITRHGGRIWAESRPDAGATFYFALPLPRNMNVEALWQAAP
ncbi:MAG: ATP-binding protein [Spongiibacteraceae bacterium]